MVTMSIDVLPQQNEVLLMSLLILGLQITCINL